MRFTAADVYSLTKQVLASANFEGKKGFVYVDTVGVLTVGIGFAYRRNKRQST